MPATQKAVGTFAGGVNLSSTYPGLDAATQSLRVWLYAAPVAFPTTGTMPGGTVALADAHYVVYEGYPGRNATGTRNLPRQVLGSGSQTLPELFPAATDLESAIEAAFPPPGA
jgi:hypothetical protein